MTCDRRMLDYPRPDVALQVSADHLIALAHLVDALQAPLAVLECTGQLCFANPVARRDLDRLYRPITDQLSRLCPCTDRCSDRQGCPFGGEPPRSFPLCSADVLVEGVVYRVHLVWLSRERPGLVLATWSRLDRARPCDEPDAGMQAEADGHPRVHRLLYHLEQVRANTETTARFAVAEQEALERDLEELTELTTQFELATQRMLENLNELLALLHRGADGSPGPLLERVEELRDELAIHLEQGRSICRSSLNAVQTARNIGHVAQGIAHELEWLMQQAKALFSPPDRSP